MLRRKFSDFAEKKLFYDILVSGGGVVGSAFVLSVLKNLPKKSSSFHSTFKIGIIESGNGPPSLDFIKDSPPDIRVYALSPKSISVLDSIGAWKFIEPRSQPYSKMQVWESFGPGMVRFNAKDIKVSNNELGRICEGTLVFIFNRL
jgi:2-polyprenyl-6-methoxyphenol hydroxylase-like FAD-dependent oxidoreductase